MSQEPDITLEDVIWTLDAIGDAADATQEVPYPQEPGADLIIGTIGELAGREFGLSEGDGARLSVNALELLLTETA